MPRRIESPSSLQTYKQCPRKYYYQYIERKPTTQTVHTLRGNIVHAVLNKFFATPPQLDENYPEHCITHIRQLFDTHWNKQAFVRLGAATYVINTMYHETLLMLFLWLDKFLVRLSVLNLPLPEAFQKLTPLREQEFISFQLSIKGYVDVIEQHNGKVRIMDYKTGNKSELTEEYKLQLGIYALLYREKHGTLPDEAGIYFLRHPAQFEQTLRVTEELLHDTQLAIAAHHNSTGSDQMQDYHQKIGPLCKWSSGQCDFYGLCFPSQRKLGLYQ